MASAACSNHVDEVPQLEAGTSSGGSGGSLPDIDSGASGTGGNQSDADADAPEAPLVTGWAPLNSDGAPSARQSSTAIWTGSEMIVWGGSNDSGPLASGGVYTLAADSWSATSSANAPSARQGHSAAWTGSEMVVWGGCDTPTTAFADGARYNPAMDSWTAMSAANAPTVRSGAQAVLTGSKLIVWGGTYKGTNPLDGGIYDLANDSWSPITQPPQDFLGRIQHSTVWTGSRMIVWGGYSSQAFKLLNDGASYDPASDTWQLISQTAAPSPRDRQVTAWTGSKMVLWGGTDSTYLDTGGIYDPAADSWTATPSSGAPLGRMEHVSVWTGSQMLIWGGYGGMAVKFLNSGGIFTPG